MHTADMGFARLFNAPLKPLAELDPVESPSGIVHQSCSWEQNIIPRLSVSEEEAFLQKVHKICYQSERGTNYQKSSFVYHGCSFRTDYGFTFQCWVEQMFLGNLAHILDLNLLWLQGKPNAAWPEQKLSSLVTSHHTCVLQWWKPLPRTLIWGCQHGCYLSRLESIVWVFSTVVVVHFPWNPSNADTISTTVACPEYRDICISQASSIVPVAMAMCTRGGEHYEAIFRALPYNMLARKANQRPVL